MTRKYARQQIIKAMRNHGIDPNGIPPHEIVIDRATIRPQFGARLQRSAGDLDMKASATVYFQSKGEHRIGITLEGSPSASVQDIHELIDYLQALIKYANQPEKYLEPQPYERR